MNEQFLFESYLPIIPNDFISFVAYYSKSYDEFQIPDNSKCLL
jgi:hypothetical protein